MRNWKGFEGCSLVFGVPCQDFLADWEKLRNLRTDDDPAKIRNRFRPNVSYNSRELSSHNATWRRSVTNPNWKYVPYNSRASPQHQASRCHSVTTKTACFMFPSLPQDVKVVYYVHKFCTSKTNFNIILAPAQHLQKQVNTKIVHF
jgi:hypothetical protein